MAAVRRPFHSTTNHTILLGPVSTKGKGTENQEYYCWLKNATEGGLPNGLTSQGTFAWKDQALSVSHGYFDGRENAEYMRPRIREDLLPHDFSRWRDAPKDSALPKVTSFSQERDDIFYYSSPSDSPERLCSPSASVGSPSFNSRLPEVFENFINPSAPVTSAERRGTYQSPGQTTYYDNSDSYLGETHPAAASDVSETVACLEAKEEADNSSMAAMRGRGGGSVDQALYQNLVEMIPLMETFMDQQGGRSSFLHRASLIYTPAPTRDGQARKTVESPSKIKRPNSLRRASILNKQVDGKESSPRWEESENILRRVEGDGSEETPAACGSSHQHSSDFEGRAEVFFLQSQIEELKRQLLEKDNLLQYAQQAHHQAQQAMEDAANQADMQRLQFTIEALRQELWEKDCMAQTAQSHLALKQEQIEEMQSLLERLEANYHAQNSKTAQVEEELNGFRCQVAALEFQLNAAYQDGSARIQSQVLSESMSNEELSADSQSSVVSSSDLTSSDHGAGHVSHPESGSQSAASAECKREYEKMEVARRQYLAAVVVAREHPCDETLDLVAELRMRLQAFLTQPSFSFASSNIAVAGIQ